MKRLEINKMEQLEGGSFWGGLACGIGAAVIATATGPVAPLTYAATLAGCINMVFY